MIGIKLKELREKSGLTKYRVAKLMGVHITTISNIENDKNFTTDLMEKYIEVLNATLEIKLPEKEMN